MTADLNYFYISAQDYLKSDIISEGWDKKQHIHSCLIHVEIIEEKVWIQCDNTEEGITNEMVALGINREDIVLGFHEPSVRKYTGFATA